MHHKRAWEEEPSYVSCFAKGPGSPPGYHGRRGNQPARSYNTYTSVISVEAALEGSKVNT